MSNNKNTQYQLNKINNLDQKVSQSKISKKSGLAIASMVLGIVSLSLYLVMSFFASIFIILSIVGLIFGIIAYKKRCINSGQAIAGIVMNIVSITLSLLIITFVAITFISINHIQTQNELGQSYKT